jgi:predicted Zn-ribbon and HTH transcriptional regulator
VNYVNIFNNCVTFFKPTVLTFIKTKNKYLSQEIFSKHLLNPTKIMNATAILKRTVIKKKITGQSRPIICNDCGNQWAHVDGSGFRSAIFYCDLCANRKSMFQDRLNKMEFLNPANLKQCECGGSFVLKATIRCPQCKSTDLEISSQFTPWD